MVSNDHPMFSAALKVSRAKQHLDDVAKTVGDYLAREPIRTIVEFRACESIEVLKVESMTAVPAEVAGPIGDCIHNLRTVFDLIASASVRLVGASTKSCYFPICQTEAYFEDALKKVLNRAPDTAKSIVKELQPFSGNEIISELHKLDILDKHRSIIPVAGGTIDTKIDFLKSVAGSEEASRIRKYMFDTIGLHGDTELNWYPRNETLFLQVETVLARQENRLAPKGFEGFRPVFDVVFGPDQECAGEPVVAKLSEFLGFTEFAFEEFRTRVFQ